MYNVSYAEVLEDAGTTGRGHEREAMERAAGLLRKAAECGPRSREAVDALYFARRLWSIVLEDLASAENGLPEELRANIFSIGVWALKEIDRIRREESEDFAGMAEICDILAEGLS